MLRSKFLGTVLVIILGVNLGAWTLSVATAPGDGSTAPLSVPISAPAVSARSQAASVELTQSTYEAPVDDTAAVTATTTDSTSSIQ